MLCTCRLPGVNSQRQHSLNKIEVSINLKTDDTSSVMIN